MTWSNLKFNVLRSFVTMETNLPLYFVEICQVSEKLWLFNHKRADFLLPNFGFKRSLLGLLNSKEKIFIELQPKRALTCADVIPNG